MARSKAQGRKSKAKKLTVPAVSESGRITKASGKRGKGKSKLNAVINAIASTSEPNKAHLPATLSQANETPISSKSKLNAVMNALVSDQVEEKKKVKFKEAMVNMEGGSSNVPITPENQPGPRPILNPASSVISNKLLSGAIKHGPGNTPKATSKKRKRMTALDCMPKDEVASSPVITSTPLLSSKQTKESIRESGTNKLLPNSPQELPPNKHATPQDESKNNEDQDQELPEGSFIGYPSFDAYSNKLLPAVVNFHKANRQLPSTKDEYDFYQSYPTFMSFSSNQGQRVLQLIGKVFKHHHLYQAWNTTPSNTVTGIEEQTEAVVEANDTLLERVDKIIDMIHQDLKAPKKLDIQQKSNANVLVAAWNTGSSGHHNKPIRLLHSKNILRPQLRWKSKPDNSHNPFVPFIRVKPHSKVPLQKEYEDLIQLERDGTDDISTFLKSARGEMTTYPHPYTFELGHFEPLPWQLELGLKQEPFEVKDTPFTIIDKADQLDSLYGKLKEAREIAVDLEAHSYRSFLGFTCLMQLSTRKEDFLVDTLALRFQLEGLNDIFTNPNILKVFHGAHNDILWLQRDLGLYVVNMFDTFHAAKQLSLPRCSLAYLLQRYCDVTPDKQYQLADWRIRPLPEVMMKYAREDTHYLLYVYDCVRYELIQKGMFSLETVYRNSCNECMNVFTKPLFTEDSYLDVYDKIRVSLKPQQKECLRLLYKWRDTTARSEDESTAFVLPNHMMFKISELLPHDQEGILACCNPPPPLTRLHGQELHRLVEKARHYNPLLDPRNQEETAGEEYTPGYMDNHHQEMVEERSMLYTPDPEACTTGRSSAEPIFYVPRCGPDVRIKWGDGRERRDGDVISVTSDTGNVYLNTDTRDLFSALLPPPQEISEVVAKVRESMVAPFRLFMSKIEQLKRDEDEELKKKKEEEGIKQVYPLKQLEAPLLSDNKDDVNGDAIIFTTKDDRTNEPSADAPPTVASLRATSKRFKKTVGDTKPFNYEEITMASIAKEESVKPREHGEMLDKAGEAETGRAQSIKQRTAPRSGNRSGFQNFLKKKFKRK